ncbi:MAG TPA: hypothetical protein VLH08_04760 [Acidobacteriota bacterium]|nr:hypothetical protein [Acidobacteriota bacterium]
MQSDQNQDITKEEILGWSRKIKDKRTEFAGIYYLPTDKCYRDLKGILPRNEVRFFKSPEEAQKMGFVRWIFGFPKLKKYVEPCFPLYDQYLMSNCEKVLFTEEAEAKNQDYIRIDNVRQRLYEGEVVGVKPSNVYFTPCDPLYQCVIDKIKKGITASECKFWIHEYATVVLFSSEQSARQAGFMNIYESYLQETESDDW